MAYGYFRILNQDFNYVEKRIRETLQQNGFGVITEIDVKNTIKTKLNKDFKPYKILGACNPVIAHQALTKEPDVGLLLPCNIIIEDMLDGNIKIGAINAEVMLSVTGRDDLGTLAEEVNLLLKNAMDSV